MNDLLNIVSTAAIGTESPPSICPHEAKCSGDDAFASLLAQLGLTASPPGMLQLTQSRVQRGEEALVAPSLLQLLGSARLTGHLQAMDGSVTGLPATSPTAVPQDLDMLSCGVGELPAETPLIEPQVLISANSLLAAARPIVVEELSPSRGISKPAAELAGQVPAELMLTREDLEQLRMLLGERPNRPNSASVRSAAGIVESLEVGGDALSESGTDVVNLKGTLREQFPTLNIKELSAQLHLKSPALVKSALLSNESTVSESKVTTEELPSGVAKPIATASATATQASALPTVEAPGITTSQEAKLQTAGVAPAAQSVTGGQAGVVTAAQATRDAVAVKDTTPETSPNAVKALEQGSLEKTAIKAAESTQEYAQLSEQWSKAAGNRNDIANDDPIANTRQSQIEQPKFRIQFDRFQIDALLKRSEISLQLQPASLGSMRVKLVSTPHEVTARFETTSEAARTAVEQNLSQLRESLDKAGIKVDHIEVVLDEQRARQQQSHYQSQRRQQPEGESAQTSGSVSESEVGSGGSVTRSSMLGGLNLLA